MTRDLSEDALAESFTDFWWQYDTRFLWIESQHTWYVSAFDSTNRKPIWVPDFGFDFMRLVRDHIRGIAEELVGDKSKLRSLATLRAVVELLKIDFSGTEDDLDEEELAFQIAWKIRLREPLPPEREQQAEQKSPPLPPRQPHFSPLPSAKEVKTRIATAADAFARTPRVR